MICISDWDVHGWGRMNSGPSILEYIGMEVISAIICDDFPLCVSLLSQGRVVEPEW